MLSAPLEASLLTTVPSAVSAKLYKIFLYKDSFYNTKASGVLTF